MIPGLLDGIILQIVIKSNAPSLANVDQPQSRLSVSYPEA